jgi:hypothetical protein
MAKSTSDAELAANLIDVAANLKDQVGELSRATSGIKPPDVQTEKSALAEKYSRKAKAAEALAEATRDQEARKSTLRQLSVGAGWLTRPKGTTGSDHSLCRAAQLNVRSGTIHRQLDWKSPALDRVECREHPNANQPPSVGSSTAPAYPQAGAVSLADHSPARRNHFTDLTKLSRNPGPLTAPPAKCRAARNSLPRPEY